MELFKFYQHYFQATAIVGQVKFLVTWNSGLKQTNPQRAQLLDWLVKTAQRLFSWSQYLYLEPPC